MMLDNQELTLNFVKRFRWFASEYLELRRSRSNLVDHMHLTDELHEFMREVLEKKLLPDELQSRAERSELHWNVILNRMIGYRSFVDITETDSDFPEGFGRVLELRPGWIDDVWPKCFPVFRCMSDHSGEQHGEMIVRVKKQYYFGYVGAYSKLCELLAESLERKVASSADQVIVDVQACIQSLRKCAQDFQDARNHRGAESFRLLNYIRKGCNSVLGRLWDTGYLRSIVGIDKVVADGDIAHLFLAEHLIGFTKSHEVGSGYWELKSGLLEQESIYLSEVDGPADEFTQWDVHGFEVLGRYVAGCEKLAKIVEQEAVSRSDRMVIDASRPEDGLFDENRRLIWGGIQFTLTTNQAMVFRLLVEAYPNDVLVSQFEDIGVRVLRDSFRRKNAEGKNEYDPLWYLIGSGSRKDSKRMVDPKVARNDPRIISQSPT